MEILLIIVLAILLAVLFKKHDESVSELHNKIDILEAKLKMSLGEDALKDFNDEIDYNKGSYEELKKRDDEQGKYFKDLDRLLKARNQSDLIYKKTCVHYHNNPDNKKWEEWTDKEIDEKVKEMNFNKDGHLII